MKRTPAQRAASRRNLEKARAAKKKKSDSQKAMPSNALKTAMTGTQKQKLNNFSETLDILARIQRRHGNTKASRKTASVARKSRKLANGTTSGIMVPPQH